MAPRGFFEVGRRNLWGKNRAVNLFTRVSLRSRDIVLSTNGVRLRAAGGRRRLWLQRVPRRRHVPRAAPVQHRRRRPGDRHPRPGDSIELQLHARARRGPRRECACRRATAWSGAIRTSTRELFDERFTDEEKPLIDRLFPQVRLSKFSGSFIRDTRNDVIDPDGGTFVILDTELAPRVIGSEVGFVRTFLQGFAYYRVPAPRRTVLAFGARVGAAHGFRRDGGAGGRERRSRDWSRRQSDRRRRSGPAGERAVLRRRRHDGPRLLARPARHRRDDQPHRVSDRRQRPGRAQRRTASHGDRQLRRRRVHRRRQRLPARHRSRSRRACAPPPGSASATSRRSVRSASISASSSIAASCRPGGSNGAACSTSRSGRPFEQCSQGPSTGFSCSWLLLMSCGSIFAQQLLDRIVARVNGVAITLTDVKAAIALGIVDPPEAAAIEQLIDRQLVLAEVARFLPPEPSAAAIAVEAGALTTRAGDGCPRSSRRRASTRRGSARSRARTCGSRPTSISDSAWTCS